ncbi:Actinorhodin polyketide synthase acyl carrier protein [Frankia canadensis]|uniref:Actinorhodin polyketide synthase acyl carrier protein n=1 Tax=Frankia canadensis TaxID=1836972 RepID=A0A2I2KS55_9ACTN|nr:acyl carrier protein [Frankia canadensis]SNQ48495.1 Actinorhodin polyketide synthase acyl carrier protein [Frankia canadensis]SOU55785.1 Actinorhodin polyketide synthase acyl carrier protein [Frankia canadensis]
MSRTMTIDELRDLLVECAGGDDAAAPAGDISNVPFEDLGYDSLALIETATRLKLERGVVVPDEVIAQARTAGELLAEINERIAA